LDDRSRIKKETPALELLQKELLFHFQMRSDAVTQNQRKKVDFLSVANSFRAKYKFLSEWFGRAQII
jgi:hypothetical protein